MRHPGILEGSGYENAIEMMRSMDLYRLIEFRRKAALAAVEATSPASIERIVETRYRTPDGYGHGLFWSAWTCRKCVADVNFGIPGARAWWTTYLKECQTAVRATLLPEAVSDTRRTFPALAKAGRCETCSTSVASDMVWFVAELQSCVERNISAVSVRFICSQSSDLIYALRFSWSFDNRPKPHSGMMRHLWNSESDCTELKYLNNVGRVLVQLCASSSTMPRATARGASIT
jgi:hypothetical protein